MVAAQARRALHYCIKLTFIVEWAASTHGNPDVPGIFAVEAAGHAAANSLWISYAGPAAADTPPAALVTPDGAWAAQCAAGTPGLAVADVTTSTDSPARRWRRTVREIRS